MRGGREGLVPLGSYSTDSGKKRAMSLSTQAGKKITEMGTKSPAGLINWTRTLGWLTGNQTNDILLENYLYTMDKLRKERKNSPTAEEVAQESIESVGISALDPYVRLVINVITSLSRHHYNNPRTPEKDEQRRAHYQADIGALIQVMRKYEREKINAEDHWFSDVRGILEMLLDISTQGHGPTIRNVDIAQYYIYVLSFVGAADNPLGDRRKLLQELLTEFEAYIRIISIPEINVRILFTDTFPGLIPNENVGYEYEWVMERYKTVTGLGYHVWKEPQPSAARSIRRRRRRSRSRSRSRSRK